MRIDLFSRLHEDFPQWREMGPGGLRGLQNRCRRVILAGVGSIPSLSAILSQFCKSLWRYAEGMTGEDELVTQPRGN